ncbi:MAG: pilus assembly protein TadG-related protein, partial [Methylocystis sp.]|nr:pilus assembly protein TadG-related protein [Methylocystis sp.]
MRRMLASCFWRLRNDKRGATAVLMGITLPVVVGFSGLAIDVGNILYTRSRLEVSTDLAALAGAKDINCCKDAPGTALTAAENYASLNALPGVTTTTTPTLKCLTALKAMGGSCSGPDAANAIVVQQQAQVPVHFLKLLGYDSVAVSATSTAAANGGPPRPLNVMLVLDTTGSMNTRNYNCPTVPNATRLSCALAGVRTLLAQLWPHIDQVGLMVFPGLKNSSYVKNEYCSPQGSVQIAAYNASPVYSIISSSTDFRSAGNPPPKGLNASSNLVKAAGGATGCSGVQAVGGVGTYFADAITQAQAQLVATKKPEQQNVMIVLSDGDAGASKSYMPTGKDKNQCRQAITAAQNATKAGTWVFSLAYGASTNPTPGSCPTDTPAISACSTMQQIASDSSKFYSDVSGGTSS